MSIIVALLHSLCLFSKGLCRLTIQPKASGLWTVHFKIPVGACKFTFYMSDLIRCFYENFNVLEITIQFFFRFRKSSTRGKFDNRLSLYCGKDLY